jgi:hypothetical protein
MLVLRYPARKSLAICIKERLVVFLETLSWNRFLGDLRLHQLGFKGLGGVNWRLKARFNELFILDVDEMAESFLHLTLSLDIFLLVGCRDTSDFRQLSLQTIPEVIGKLRK